MLMHGRLFLTPHGFMLDEIKSLLQKALRRKDVALVTMATKELLGYGKDQLPWKSIFTFYFEDHGLNGGAARRKLLELFRKNDKYGCIELLLKHCGTCRIASCLPVVAMDPEYDPDDWDSGLQPDSEFEGLVAVKYGAIRFDILMQHLKIAWVEKNHNNLVTYIKLATMVDDQETRTVTQKGLKYVICDVTVKRPSIALVILSLFYRLSAADVKLQNYVKYGIQFAATVPDSPIRLILCDAVVYRCNQDNARHVTDIQLGAIDWSAVGTLDSMPPWAVDKHTYRGKFGRGTSNLLKKPQRNLFVTEEKLEEFHGVRPQVGVEHFFQEGCRCMDEVMQENPYWEITKAVYLEMPPTLRKTVRMTAVYYQDMKGKFPSIFLKSGGGGGGGGGAAQKGKDRKRGAAEDATGTSASKRMRRREPAEEDGTEAEQRRQKGHQSGNDHESVPGEGTAEKVGETTGESSKTTSAEIPKPAATSFGDKPEAIGPSSEETMHSKEAKSGNPMIKSAETKAEKNPDVGGEGMSSGPLLQLPTGSAKVYTRVELGDNKVRKGPYRDVKKASQVVFFHSAMKDILGDSHTMSVTQDGRHVIFPLCKAPGSSPEVTRKTFYDCIAKKEILNGAFVLRESLGVIQVHRLASDQMADLPLTFWGHFLFRFMLNIGDSGLYNAITDSGRTFLYGIDLDDSRKNVNGAGLIDYLFVKLPRKDLCSAIKDAIRVKKDELTSIVEKGYKQASALCGPRGDTALRHRAAALGVKDAFDQELFNDRYRKVKKAIEQL